MLIDEFNKNNHAQHYGCAPSGQCTDFVENFMHGDWYSMLAEISISGYDVVCSVLRLYNSDQFQDFIIEQVVCPTKFTHFFHRVCVG